jgi:myo-inositol-hexaphosphate 3-phosphohydrolase
VHLALANWKPGKPGNHTIHKTNCNQSINETYQGETIQTSPSSLPLLDETLPTMRFFILSNVLAASVLIPWPVANAKSGSGKGSFDGPFRVDKYPEASLESLYSFNWNATFVPGGTQFLAGVTGLTHKSGDIFYAISERDENPDLFWTLDLDHDDPPRITSIPANLTLPADSIGNPGGPANLDSPQAIAYKKGTDKLYISHNLDSVSLFDRDNGVRKVPDNFASDLAAATLEEGKGLESLSFDPARPNVLWTASEAGADGDGHDGNWVRFTAIDLGDKSVVDEYVYEKDTDGGNGVVSIIALDYDGTFLVLERVATGTDYGVDHAVKLYFAYCDKTLNIQGYNDPLDSLDDIENFLQKKLLLELDSLDAYTSRNVGRFEAMALRSMNHKKARIVLVSNNGYQEYVKTQVLTVDLDIDVLGVVEPEGQTDSLTGDPVDWAVSAKAWVHPNNPEASLIFGTLSKSGLGVYSLDGSELAKFKHKDGTVKYYGVDLLYAFPLYDNNGNLDLYDLVLVTDRTSGELVVLKIDPDADDGGLVAITDSSSPPELDNPRAVAAYTSPFTGRSYIFVSLVDDHEIVQLELTSDNDGQVHFEEIDRRGGNGRIDLGSGRSLGMVVDREFGYLYTSVLNRGILKWDAEPHELSSGDDPVEIADEDEYTGLDIYYGEEYNGYIIASFRADSSFAVFDRGGDNDFLGRFSVGANHDVDLNIDKTDRTEGLGIINVNLGPEFSCGLVVVQDRAASDPTFEVEDKTLRNTKTNFKLGKWLWLFAAAGRKIDAHRSCMIDHRSARPQLTLYCLCFLEY